MNEENLPNNSTTDEGVTPVDTTFVPKAQTPSSPKPKRSISLSAAIASMVTAVVIAVMSTFAVTTAHMKESPPPVADSAEELPGYGTLQLIDYIFRQLSVFEQGEDFEEMILDAYVASTGDIYAEYFTAEEFAAMNSEQNGEMSGIGISIVSGTCTVGGIDYAAIVVANVYKDSPAEEAGVLPGDYIMYVGVGEDRVSVADIGYTEAVNRMSGEVGTICSFTVFRLNETGNQYTEIKISAERRKLTKQSVYGRVYSLDPTVGVIKISEFDNTTAPQFDATVQALMAKGCTSFVLDLRGNPGGLLTSVEDMLTFFLQEGDTMISVKDNRGNETTTKLTLSDGGQVLVGSKNLTRADVGKYRELNFSVLVNGYSASAAELFTANMRDYDLATIVGTNTFGKGSMQSTYPLSPYGYEGALKLTVAYYYPPSGEGYHGIGIKPDDGYEVELSADAKKININLLTDEQDNQLAAAVEALKPAS